MFLYLFKKIDFKFCYYSFNIKIISYKMDLSINRLKVLGEEEIQRLDLKITEYKNSNQSSILDKSINEIKTQISDLSSICKDIQTELNSKTATFNQLQNSLKEHQLKYERLNENILSTEKSITEYENRKTELESQFESMDETISRLKIDEKKSKDNFEELNIKLEQRKIEFKKEKEVIENEIKKLELKMNELMSSSLSSHNNFVSELKSIELKQEVDDTQAIFDNIKFDLLINLSTNIMNYSKAYNFKCFVKYVGYCDKKNYTSIISMSDYISLPNTSYDFHKDILKCKGERTGGLCKLCKYNGFKLGDQYMYENHTIYRDYTTEKKIKLKEDHNKTSIMWFEQNYDKILENIIIHPELLILIKKLCYQDFYNLFKNYYAFNINGLDTYQFICFVAFIATNGYNEKCMKLIDIE